MADRHQETPSTVHLDVDWLVGKRVDPRLVMPLSTAKSKKHSPSLSSNFIGATLGIATSLGAIVFWPALSKNWTDAEFQSLLTESMGVPAVASMLEDLDQINRNLPPLSRDTSSSDDLDALVRQLASPDVGQQEMAFRAISDRIQVAFASPSPVDGWLQIAQGLNRANLISSESRRLRGQLIEQIASLSADKSDSIDKRALDALCYSMLPRSDWHGILKLDHEPQPWVFEEDARTKPLVYRLSSIDSSFGDSNWTNVGAIRNLDLAAEYGLALDGSIQGAASGYQIPLPMVPAPEMQSVAATDNVATGLQSTLIQNQSSQEVVTTQLNAPVSLVSSNGSRQRLVASDENSPIASVSDVEQRFIETKAVGASSPRIGQPKLVFQGSSATEPSSVIRVETQTLLELLTALSSPDEENVRTVCEELFRRRVPGHVVDLALAFAREDEEIKLNLIETVLQLDSAYAVPLLNWLGRADELKVRHRAIVLLGAMQGMDAKQTLRSLAHRESDPRLQQVIQKSLADAGSVRQARNVGAQ